MKSVSLILRIVAIVGAIACVALWFTTKGIIKQATSDMSGVGGSALLEKSAKIPGILDDKAKISTDLSATKTKVSELENRVKEALSSLESERARNDKTNKDLVKSQTELRQTKIALEDSSKKIAELGNLVEALKKEIEKRADKTDDAAKTEALNAKYNTLNNSYIALQKQYEEAKLKADLLDIAIVVVEKEIDAEKNVERTTTKYFAPYVRTGDITTITIVEDREDLIALNRGKNDGLGERQIIDLKNKESGDLIAQVTVVEVGPDFAIAAINPKLGKPETLENGDMLELVKTIELKAPEAENTSSEAPQKEEADADGDE